jgi:hypothetical protein
VGEVRQSIDELGLADDAKAEAESDLDTLDAQLSSPRPKATIVRESLRSLRNVLEGAAGSLLASKFLTKLLVFLGAP